MDPSIVLDHDISIIKEQNAENKIEDISKLDDSIKFMNYNNSKPNSSYYINRQGAENRRHLFEQIDHGKVSKELSEFEDDQRWDEFQEELNRVKRDSTYRKGIFQNLEVQVPQIKKNADLEVLQLNQNIIQKSEEDYASFQSPFNNKVFFDQKQGNGFEKYEQEKERCISFQETQNPIKNPALTSLHQIDTPNSISNAKVKRQSHIAMKMKGIQNHNLHRLSCADDTKSPNSANSKKLNKMIQNQMFGQLGNSIPSSANQSHIACDHNFQNVQIDDRTLLQDDETHIEQPKKQHLIILTYMKRFINQLLKRLSYSNFDLLTQQHFEMIGDSSIPPQYYRKIISNSLNFEYQKMDILSRRRAIYQQLGKKTKRKSNVFQTVMRLYRENHNCQLILSFFPIIQPQSLFLILWELLLLCILFFYLLFSPLKASFEFNFDHSENFIFYAYKIPVFVFCVDIILGFQTGYYELGRVVTGRKLIAIRYFKKKFLTDFLCTLMMILNTYLINSNFLEIFTLIFRINQMKMKTAMINDHFRIQNKYPTFYEMVKITVFILFMSHVCGCGFHLVGQIYSDGNNYAKESKTGIINNWIDSQGLNDVNWQTRYVFSVYFSVMTMITVGYGDIYPVNIYEKLYVIGMTIITCGVFAYCVNSISSIFSQLSQKSIIFKQKQYDLLNYMNQKNIKMDTQTKIMKYLDYLEEESDQCIVKGESVLSQFPIELKEQVMREYFVKILKDVQILNENFSISFLNAISLKMKEKRLGPGEKILIKNSRLSALCFITKGSIEYSIEDGDYQRAICSVQSDKNVIDFRLFVTGIKSNISMQSATMSNIAYITYNDFMEELKRFHKDYEQFCFIRDQFLNDGRFEKVCPSCNHYGHEIYNCPQIHYQVNRSIFSQKVFYSQIQVRTPYPMQRGIDKRVSWRNIYNEAKNDLKYIRWAYIIEQHNLYNQVNIDEQMSVIESDKQFFKRCPKLKVDQIRLTKSVFTTKNMLDVIIEEGSAQSLSNSEQSDFQTEYTETQYHLKGKMKGIQQQDEDVIDSFHTTLDQQVQNMSIDKNNNDLVYCQSLSSLNQEMDLAKYINESPGNINNINNGSNKIKSEASIKRQESMQKQQYSSTQANQPGMLRSINKKLTQEIGEFVENKIRRQSKKMTTRSLAQMIQAGQMTTILDKPQSIQNQYMQNHEKLISENSSLSNSKVGYNGTLGQGIVILPSNQTESIRQLDQMVEKFKRQCIKMMTHNLKYDYLSLPSDQNRQKNSNVQDESSKVLTFSKNNSKLTNRGVTLQSVTNTMQRSEKTLKSLQDLPFLKKKGAEKEIQSAKEKPYLRYQSQMHPSNHIFGPLQFKCDKMKEYLIYYPKGNASNILKIYKKIQQHKSSITKLYNFKQPQSAISEQILSAVQLEKHAVSFSKKIAKMSRMSYISNYDIKNTPL